MEGISLALDSRFYVKSKINENDEFNDGVSIKYCSPQINSEWVYNLSDLKDILVLKVISGNKNPFLESITKSFFAFIKTMDIHFEKKSIQVEIFHDKDFYSENCIIEYPPSTPKFPIFDNKNLKKTGNFIKISAKSQINFCSRHRKFRLSYSFGSFFISYFIQFTFFGFNKIGKY